MIEQLTLLWLGSVALGATFGGLLVSVPRYRVGEDSLPGLIAFVFGLMFWALFTMHAMGFMVISGGTETTVVAESLAIPGAIGAVTCLLLLFDAAFRALGYNL